MSTFVDRNIPCPSCSFVQVRSVAKSLNGPRVPEVVDEILAARFQRYACDECGTSYTVDLPLVFLDFDARIWIGMFPLAWELRWAELEDQPRESWSKNMIDHAPPIVRSMSEGFRIRAVFGLDALREKLLCFHAGLDDAYLELLKLDLMRSTEGLLFHPGHRPSLIEVDDEGLVFAIDGMSESGAPRPGRLEVPRARLEGMRMDPAAWEPALRKVKQGPYVDVGRIMLGGAG